MSHSSLINVVIKGVANIFYKKFVRTRYFWKVMECKLLQPPEEVRGMQELRREAFQKCVKVPCLRVPEESTNRILPMLKDKLLKMQQLRPVRDFVATCDSVSTPSTSIFKEILLHPSGVKSWESLPTAKLREYKISPTDFYHNELKLTYANWRADEILEFVLPRDSEGLTSYSRIGHIIHLNLREHLLPYKYLIAKVFVDKLNGIRTVVNKSSNIDNTFRNFEFELLYGEPEYQVVTKENGIVFEFDFSHVYWNPRLSTEHERIVKMLKPNDVLYDVFAGVGPFSVPAAKKCCRVLANDLNPECFRWLTHNMKRNKCTAHAKLFNKDGRDFILSDLKDDLLKQWTEGASTSNYSIHITMNLPALAVEFLDAFRGLFEREKLAHLQIDEGKMPIVHVYTFAKGLDTKSLAVYLVEKNIGVELGKAFQSANFVRNVAPNKDMYRVTFRLTLDILTMPKNDDQQMRSLKRVAENSVDGATHVKLENKKFK